MYIKDREKIEKLLSNLVNEMINQKLIEADKKEVKAILKMLGSMKFNKC